MACLEQISIGNFLLPWGLGLITQLPQPSIPLCFRKASDSLEHDFLLEALHFGGFGENFCNVIKMLYTDKWVQYHWIHPPGFNVQGGIRQGHPISPKLFILSGQLLTLSVWNNPELQGIRILNKEYKINQFADDTSIFLTDRNMVNQALESSRFNPEY